MENTYAPLTFTNDDGSTVTVADPRYEAGGDGPVGGGNAPGRLVPASGDTTGIADTQAIRAALDTAGAEGGGIVWLDGTYYTNSPLILHTGISLRGTGWHRTVIHLAPGSNCSMILAPEGTYWYEVRDLQIDGHAEDQAGGFAGIETQSGTAPDGEMASCGIPLIERVLVRYTYGHGIYSKSVEMRHLNCFIFRTGGHGFYADRTDMWYTDCTVGESYGHGFFLSSNASECRLSGCKSWWPGYGNERGSFAWKEAAHTLLNPDSSSYFVDTGAGHQQIVNCESQDAALHGFVLRSARNKIDGSVGRNEGSVLVLGGGANQNLVRLMVSHHSPVSVGLRASPDSLVAYEGGGGSRNDVEIGWVDAGGTHQIMAGQTASPGDSNHTSNRVIMGSPEATVTRTWASTVTPDPIRGGVMVTATGDTTIANPPIDRMGHGMQFTISITQDATGGRAVTFGSRFAGAEAVDTGANRTTVWVFRCVGARWVQTAHVTY